MKLAEQLLSSCEKEVAVTSNNESMGGSDRISVKLADGHEINVHCSVDIYKCFYPDNQERVDDVEKQAKIKQAISADMDTFMQAVASKLKTMTGL